MSQSSPRPSSKTRRAAAAADEAARAARDEAAVPDAAEEQLRVIGQANALVVSELADARRRVADSKTLKQSHVDALVNATLEYVKVPDGDAVSKRIRQDEAVEKIIAALSQLYITVFQVFGSTSSSKQAERTLWLTERVKSTLTISHAPIFNNMNVTGVSSDRRGRLSSALDSLSKLAKERTMFTFDNEDKTLLSISDRPWASELRYLLSASGLLNHVEEVTPGATLVSYVQDNKALLIEARDSFIDLAVEVSSTQLATATFNTIATTAADKKPQALKTYLETVATLMHDRMQQARWIAALERGEKNDARAVKKLIDLQIVNFFDVLFTNPQSNTGRSEHVLAQQVNVDPTSNLPLLRHQLHCMPRTAAFCDST
jgi:hypothetical protein